MTRIIEDISTGVAGPEAEPFERRWSRDEYFRLGDLGFFIDQRVELIEGRIIQMAPQRFSHSMGIELVDRYLRTVFAKGYRIRVQMPFYTADGSVPEPDFAVVAGDPRRATDHPSSAVLVVEVSDTTLRYDRRKADFYAASGVPEYWILNLVDRVLEVHREPSGAAASSAVYGSIKSHLPQDMIAPAASSISPVPVSDLLP